MIERNLLALCPGYVGVSVFTRLLHSYTACSKGCRGASIAGQVAGRGDALRGSYPKAEQPPYVTKKSARNDHLFKLLCLNHFLKKGCGQGTVS